MRPPYARDDVPLAVEDHSTFDQWPGSSAPGPDSHIARHRADIVDDELAYWTTSWAASSPPDAVERVATDLDESARAAATWPTPCGRSTLRNPRAARNRVTGVKAMVGSPRPIPHSRMGMVPQGRRIRPPVPTADHSRAAPGRPENYSCSSLRRLSGRAPRAPAPADRR